MIVTPAPRRTIPIVGDALDTQRHADNALGESLTKEFLIQGHYCDLSVRADQQMDLLESSANSPTRIVNQSPNWVTAGSGMTNLNVSSAKNIL
jgi:hypothetical protein